MTVLLTGNPPDCVARTAKAKCLPNCQQSLSAENRPGDCRKHGVFDGGKWRGWSINDSCRRSTPPLRRRTKMGHPEGMPQRSFAYVVLCYAARFCRRQA